MCAELDAFIGKAVNVWSAECGFAFFLGALILIKNADVSVAEIITENEQDVRFFGCDEW